VRTTDNWTFGVGTSVTAGAVCSYVLELSQVLAEWGSYYSEVCAPDVVLQFAWRKEISL
jgi:hypothetical protein